jgi:divalent metal cation (Fe/Co/Zn/Cd) transporter
MVAGWWAGSVALTGFGLDSCIEVSSAALVFWRLRTELGRAALGPAVERRAARGAGALLLVLALTIVIASGRELITRTHPGLSPIGIVLTAISLVIMPLLARAKLLTASTLDSPALRADAYETIICAWLAFTTLAGLVLNALLGWWWADPVSALVMTPVIVREGLEAWDDH